MVKEMIGGCCVCLDERGWNENPLVYCDGSNCNVAVHQACYGIVKVPSGPWYCCKCTSTERIARVKCELCPIKEGALKRTDSGAWAHVVCALYIPEVRFGNVSTMEPIILSSIPHERFAKPCYLCDEEGRDSKLSNGACMACHKAGCKLAFHVTCAQSRRHLCEEASVNGNVQYVGYCRTHWVRRLKQIQQQQQQQQQQGVTGRTPGVIGRTSGVIISEQDIKKNFKEKKSRQRAESFSSTNSLDQKIKKKLGRPPEKTSHEFEIPENDDQAAKKSRFKEGSFSVNGLLSCTDNKLQTSSPLNTPVDKDKKVGKTFDKETSDDEHSANKPIAKKRKFKEKEKNHKTSKLKQVKHQNEADKLADSDDNNNFEDAKINKKKKVKKLKTKSTEVKKVFPQPSKLGLFENGKVSSWESIATKSEEMPNNFQDFLELQWNESAQFILSKAEHFDVASLLKTLHQLKGDNAKLEKKLTHLQSRRDRLVGVNARLAASFAESSKISEQIEKSSSPLSSMLNKLNDSSPPFPRNEHTKRFKTPEQKLASSENNVSSPDLAMLAAASAKLESNNILPYQKSSSSSSTYIPDEKPSTTFAEQDSYTLLMQPSLAPHCNGILGPGDGLRKEKLFQRSSPPLISNDGLENSESTDSADDSSSNT